MRQYPSTNSLSELVKSKDPCFICLEDEKNSLGEDLLDSHSLRGCGCKFMVHPSCWDLWAQNKTDFDCPICGKYILEVIGHSPKVEASPFSPPFSPSSSVENIIQTQYDNFEETMKKYVALFLLSLLSILVLIAVIYVTTRHS
jgi:hypothetical protein